MHIANRVYNGIRTMKHFPDLHNFNNKYLLFFYKMSQVHSILVINNDA